MDLYSDEAKLKAHNIAHSEAINSREYKSALSSAEFLTTPKDISFTDHAVIEIYKRIYIKSYVKNL